MMTRKGGLMFDRKNLRKARINAGYSVDDLVFELMAKGVRITGQSIYNWERGKHIPRVDDLVIVAEILGKPFEYFFGRNVRSGAKQKAGAV